MRYHVWLAEDGTTARELLDQARRNQITTDLIVLDLGLPDVDGLILCTTLRRMADVPIIICSARTQRLDKIISLKLGADAFIGKPFEFDEFEACVEAVRRRFNRSQQARTAEVASEGLDGDEVRLGGLLIRKAAQTVTLGGKPLHLTPTEFRLLVALASHPDELLSWNQLGELVWGYHDQGVRNLVQVHIGRLRKKLASGAALAPTIVAVPRSGYRLLTERNGLGHGLGHDWRSR
jgi:DNA-binding response OmpR family regulator